MPLSIEHLKNIRDHLKSILDLRDGSNEHEERVQQDFEYFHPPNRQTCFEGLKDLEYYKKCKYLMKPLAWFDDVKSLLIELLSDNLHVDRLKEIAKDIFPGYDLFPTQNSEDGDATQRSLSCCLEAKPCKSLDQIHHSCDGKIFQTIQNLFALCKIASGEDLLRVSTLEETEYYWIFEVLYIFIIDDYYVFVLVYFLIKLLFEHIIKDAWKRLLDKNDHMQTR
jgi:hypothetical protein